VCLDAPIDLDQPDNNRGMVALAWALLISGGVVAVSVVSAGLWLWVTT
jgi:hypothetical protein